MDFWEGVGWVEVVDFAEEGGAFAADVDLAEQGAEEELAFLRGAFGKGGAQVVEEEAEEGGGDFGEGLEGGTGEFGLSPFEVRVLLFEFVEAAQEGGGFGFFGDGVGDVVDLIKRLSVTSWISRYSANCFSFFMPPERF